MDGELGPPAARMIAGHVHQLHDFISADSQALISQRNEKALQFMLHLSLQTLC
jgi:hypothetical protein